jgi:GTPase SAR1 family protein
VPAHRDDCVKALADALTCARARKRTLRGATRVRAGKTSLMVKYVEGSFDEVCLMHRVVRPPGTALMPPACALASVCARVFARRMHAHPRVRVCVQDYIQTLGVNFMEKTVSIRNANITFSIWDLGGQREFINVRQEFSSVYVR